MKKIFIIGAGAAGMFCAARLSKNFDVTVFEKQNSAMKKLLLTGGGRCNFTNTRIDKRPPEEFYPRGARKLRKALKRFGAKDTIAYFESLGLKTKEEAKNRVFPASGDSRDVARALWRAADAPSSRVICEAKVTSVEYDSTNESFIVEVEHNCKIEKHFCHYLIMCVGGEWYSPLAESVKRMGHSFVPPLPSLFSLMTEHAETELALLSGTAVEDAIIGLRNSSKKISARGEILITHFGFGGPAVLNFTGFGARDFAELNYNFPISINWIPNFDQQKQREAFITARANSPKKLVKNVSLMGVPQKLWSELVKRANIGERAYSNLSKAEERNLCLELSEFKAQVRARSAHKAEFVTCGGLNTDEIDFASMQSKIQPKLFFAGECTDIDAITGGFNLQAAWTMAEICSQSIKKLENG